MKKTLIGMIALALILGTSTVSASPSGGKGLRGDSPRLSKLQQSLGLSEEQVEEIRSIRANGGSRDDVRAVLNDEQRAMLDTRRARRQGSVNGKPGRQLSGDERGMRGNSPRMAHLQQGLGLSDEQMTQIREIREKGGTRDEVRAVLTDEQRALMDAHRANRQGRRDSKQGHGQRTPGMGWLDSDPAADAADPAAG